MKNPKPRFTANASHGPKALYSSLDVVRTSSGECLVFHLFNIPGRCIGSLRLDEQESSDYLGVRVYLFDNEIDPSKLGRLVCWRLLGRNNPLGFGEDDTVKDVLPQPSGCPLRILLSIRP
ncbi:hypothetical protein RRF57_013153 [Xylaria bambusicola]|uniref:Uncharacterized protein n=1 Tax=Xylaria bambusicola TaxID=326684 RepID=A0AAN7UXQ6_9PEZI